MAGNGGGRLPCCSRHVQSQGACRAWCNGDPSTECGYNNTNVGDVTQQNLGNDLDTAYIMLPEQDVTAQRPWTGAG